MCSTAEEEYLPPCPLRYHLFTMRHGHSIPNSKGIICASLGWGQMQSFALSDTGKRQAAASGAALNAEMSLMGIRSVLLLVSPLSRARETAMIVFHRLTSVPVKHIHVVCDLRERFFGPLLEGQSDSQYKCVWANDVRDAHHHVLQCESPFDVWRRVRSVIAYAEEEMKQRHARGGGNGDSSSAVLLVSHGDTLQITEAAIRRVPLERHRSLVHIGQAEWRYMNPLHNAAAQEHSSSKL